VQTRRQLICPWHSGTVDQNRHDIEITRSESNLNLDPHPIIRIIQSATAIFVLGAHPVRPDQNECDTAARQDRLDVFSEVRTRTQIVHVLEDAIPAKAGFKGIEDAARHIRRVITAIPDEDCFPCHSPGPPANAARLPRNELVNYCTARKSNQQAYTPASVERKCRRSVSHQDRTSSYREGLAPKGLVMPPSGILDAAQRPDIFIGRQAEIE
jgi:hypothetical protein